MLFLTELIKQTVSIKTVVILLQFMFVQIRVFCSWETVLLYCWNVFLLGVFCQYCMSIFLDVQVFTVLKIPYFYEEKIADFRGMNHIHIDFLDRTMCYNTVRVCLEKKKTNYAKL